VAAIGAHGLALFSEVAEAESAISDSISTLAPVLQKQLVVISSLQNPTPSNLKLLGDAALYLGNAAFHTKVKAYFRQQLKDYQSNQEKKDKSSAASAPVFLVLLSVFDPSLLSSSSSNKTTPLSWFLSSTLSQAMMTSVSQVLAALVNFMRVCLLFFLPRLVLLQRLSNIATFSLFVLVHQDEYLRSFFVSYSNGRLVENISNLLSRLCTAVYTVGGEQHSALEEELLDLLDSALSVAFNLRIEGTLLLLFPFVELTQISTFLFFF
jgi:hypothetical protein